MDVFLLEAEGVIFMLVTQLSVLIGRDIDRKFRWCLK